MLREAKEFIMENSRDVSMLNCGLQRAEWSRNGSRNVKV
jgi:hypothetical protein